MDRWSAALVWLLPFGLLVGAIVTVPLRILDVQGLPRYNALRTELQHVQSENSKLRREVRSLKEDVEDLRTDPHALERIARDELGMVKDGELIFQFPN